MLCYAKMFRLARWISASFHVLLSSDSACKCIGFTVGKWLTNYDTEATPNFATFRVSLKKTDQEDGSAIIF
jgi:hypothetical protein